MKEKLLLVDSDANARTDLAQMLQLEGYEVLHANNGKVGLNMVSRLKPDLVISEVMMPYMDGFALLRKLRSADEFCDLPFVFLSVRGTERDIREGMAAGSDDYLKKPVDTSDILQAIKTRLALRYVRSLAQINKKIFGEEDEGKVKSNHSLKLSKLTRTEMRILRLISEKWSSRDIADQMDITPKTVENHRYKITRKLGLSGSHALTYWVLEYKNLESMNMV